MSENNIVEQEDSVPEEIISIQKTLTQLNSFKNLVETGTWTGKNAKDIVELKEFLKDIYSQAYGKFTNHPYYIKHVGKSEEDENN